MHTHRSSSRGFTLPELLVAIAVLVVLIALAGWLLHPKSYAAERRNAQRWLALAELVQAVNQYQADTGSLPAGVGTQPRLIGTAVSASTIDLCDDLVPKYIPDVPFDQSVGAETVADPSIQAESCKTTGVAYNTGFSISLSKQKLLTVAAPAAELGQEITLTRQY